MDKDLRWKVIVVALTVAIGLFFAIPWDRPLFKGTMRYGLDLQGGTELLYRVQEPPPEEKDKYEGRDLALEIIRIIKVRIDPEGIKQIKIQKQGKDRILIQMPGADQVETEKVRNLVEQPGHLKFRLCATDNLAREYEGRTPPPNYEWLDYKYREEDKDLVMIDDGYNLGGDIIKKANRSTDEAGFPAVGFEIRLVAQDLFRELTSNNSEDALGMGNGRKLAIILDDEVVSAPVIRSTISSSGIITGGETGFEKDEQERLITVLNSGYLPVGVTFEEINHVGPGLGTDSIQKGFRAILIAGVLVLIFMAVYYLGSGMVANFALCLNLVLILGAMNLLSATMTLPGIAGILLTVGMAVDANILIFERIREEKAKGKTLHQSLKNGYERAFVTIVDANVTTLITAAILWLVGTGPVRGFAVTLSIGILASMFTAIFVTRVIFELLLLGRIVTEFRMFQLLKNPRFNITGQAGKAVTFSVLAVAAGVLVFSYRGERNLGIDFREGTVVDFNLKSALPISKVRKEVTTFTRESEGGPVRPYATAEIQELWDFELGAREQAHRFEIRTSFGNKPDVVREEIKTIFAGSLVPGPFESAKGVPDVDNKRFEFQFQFALKNEIRLVDLTPPLLEAFQEALPGALSPDDPAGLPGTLKSTDPGRTISSEFEFKSARIDFPEGWGNIRDRLQPFLETARRKIETLEYVEVEGDFPKRSPKIRRYADLSLTVNFIEPVPPAEVHDAFFPDQGGESSRSFPRVKIEPGRDAPESETFHLTAEDFWTEGDEANPWDKRLDLWKTTLREAIKKEKISSNLSEPVSRSQGISPIVASELVEKGILAILFSLIAIVIYVAIRFQVGSMPAQFHGSGLFNFVREMGYRARYGFAAIVALAHDVLFTMGALAILAETGLIEVKIDLQILAAFLTIIGYSLNDTIVVFDRIRENLNSGEKLPFREVVNLSINQTLSRTLLTSSTTFLVVLSLFILGGSIIHGFSFTLLLGVIVGTYSSAFIASPVLLAWERVSRRETAPARKP